MKIEKEFEKMCNKQKGQFINAINDALINYPHGNSVYVDLEHKDFKEFLKHYVRDDDEVIRHNIEYYELNCPIRFLDTDAIIEEDNDYVQLIDGWHLNVYWIFECNYNKLIRDGVLVEL